jgi:hypothetical protein
MQLYFHRNVTSDRPSLVYWEEYYESMQSWLVPEVWNIKTPNLSIFSTEKIPRILNPQMVQGGDLIS